MEIAAVRMTARNDAINVALRSTKPVAAKERRDVCCARERKNAISECFDYKIPVIHLMGPKGDGDMQSAKRD